MEEKIFKRKHQKRDWTAHPVVNSSLQDHIMINARELEKNFLYACHMKAFKTDCINIYFDYLHNHIKVSLYSAYMIILADTRMIPTNSEYYSHYVKKILFDTNEDGTFTDHEKDYLTAFINACILAYLKYDVDTTKCDPVILGLTRNLYRNKSCYSKKTVKTDAPIKKKPDVKGSKTGK